jgi:chemotaxis protein MotB
VRKRKRHHHEEHEEHVNHEAWVIPYADMLTLLMAMFLVLWAIGQVDIDKAKAVSTGFADEFGLASSAGKGAGAGGKGVLDGTESAQPPPIVETKLTEKQLHMSPEERKAAQESEREQLIEVQRSISESADQAGLANAVRFRSEERGLVVSIVAEGVLFEPGSAAVQPAGRVVLDTIADALAKLPNRVAVEGHTDNVPINTAQFPSNWELSTARASSVLRYLAERHGISEDRLSAAGYADRRPVGSNETSGGRAQNRRVDIAVIALYPHEVATAGSSGGGRETASAPKGSNEKEER